MGKNGCENSRKLSHAANEPKRAEQKGSPRWENTRGWKVSVIVRAKSSRVRDTLFGGFSAIFLNAFS